MGGWGLQAPLRRQETMERLPWQPGAASPGASRLKLGGGVLRKGGWERGAVGADLGAACPPTPTPRKGCRGFFLEKKSPVSVDPFCRASEGRQERTVFARPHGRPLTEQAVGILRTCPNAQLSPSEAS